MAKNYGIDSRVFDFLMQKRKPEVQPLPSNENQMIAAMADTSAKLGTIGGQSADTSGVQKFADTQDARQMQEQQRQLAANQSEDSRQLAIAGLLDKYNMQQDARMASASEKKADREFKLAMQDKSRSNRLQDQMTLDSAKTQNKLLLADAQRKNKPSKIQEAMDKRFLEKTYLDFVGAGKENTAQSINILQQYVDKMETQKDDIFQSGGGPITSIMPDSFRTSDSIKMRDEITGVAMQGLKDVFTGSISNEERQAMAATFYNDKLSANENLPIIKRKLKTMEDMYQNKLRMVDYYEKNGTLAGFEGLSEGDMLANLRAKDPNEMSEEEVSEGTAYAAPKGPKTTAPTPTKQKWSIGDEATNPTTGKVMVKGSDGLWYEKE